MASTKVSVKLISSTMHLSFLIYSLTIVSAVSALEEYMAWLASPKSSLP